MSKLQLPIPSISGSNQNGNTPFLRIGTRGSPLSLVQAKTVRAQLAELHQVETTSIHITPITTAGDKTQTQNLALKDIGGKGLFSKEIEQALLDNTIDLAVHSAKDMATILPDGLEMDIFLERENIADTFISLNHKSLEDLPQGAILGTSSLRRAAQMLQKRPDLKIIEFRGNVGTRLKKLKSGIADATILALAGLNRLGLSDCATAILAPDVFLPAVAQGALGLQIRSSDIRTRQIIAPLNHPQTHTQIIAERAMLAQLDGSCRTPIGVHSLLENNELTLTGQVLSPNGQQCFSHQLSGNPGDATTIGTTLGEKLIDMAGREFFERLKTL